MLKTDLQIAQHLVFNTLHVMKLSDIVIAVFLLTSVIRVAKSSVFDWTIRCFATRSC